jgi:hypothetical protein
MYEFLSSDKYLLLRQVVQLWLMFIVLLVMLRYKIPNRRLHNIVNIALAVGSVVEFVAIVVISFKYVF